nr:f-box protein pp2-b10 [Quercus suber]
MLNRTISVLIFFLSTELFLGQIEWGGTPQYWRWISLPESRFPEVAKLLDEWWFDIRDKMHTSMLSPNTNYAAYLVYKLARRVYGFTNPPPKASVGKSGEGEDYKQTVCLCMPAVEPSQQDQALPSSNSPSKEAGQTKIAEREKDTSKGVVLDATKPPATPKDSSMGKETSQSLEIVLATLSMLAKEDPKGKGLASTTAEIAKFAKATGKDNPPLKIK